MSWPRDAKLRLYARLRDRRWYCDDRECDGRPHVGWEWPHARGAQHPPAGDWRFWYLRGGRGSGKTRAGAEALASLILNAEPFDGDAGRGDWGIVAPTFGDARDVCIEGNSGLLSALGGVIDRRKNWNRSNGELWLPHGNRVFIDGADDGALRIQGKNLRGIWCDEVGLWRLGWWRIAWEQSIRFAVRLPPVAFVVTGTPKMGHPLVALLLDDPQTHISHMRTLDNAANLDPDYVADLIEEYGASRLGRQELEGEFLEDTPGALFLLDWIERDRVGTAPELDRIVVGVDPSGAADDDSRANEIGIVVAGWSRAQGQWYVLDDGSLRAGPERWAAVVVDLFRCWRADTVVAERNFGGDMVRATIHAVDHSIPVKLVSASHGKRVRADPIAVKYEQGRVRHVGAFAALERQLCSWVPADDRQASPDRLDALVWALTELMRAGYRGGHGVDSRGHRERERRVGDLVLKGDRYVDEEEH